MEKLSKYKEKRDFTKTLEPKGIVKQNKKQLSFVVQHHLASRDHYDFRLQYQGVLLSWAVPKGPSYNPQDKRLAAHVEDHPLDYQDFEGIIPKGQYGGGTVMLWDKGYYETDIDFKKGLEQGNLKFTLFGERLKGNWTLIKLKNDEKNWLLIKEKDQYAKKAAGISKFTKSIVSNKTMEEIGLIKNPFNNTSIQLAQLTDKIPQGNDWVYELKYDGYRIVSYIEQNNVRLMTRNGHDYHNYFIEVTNALSDWANNRSMVLDGEMVVVNKDGKSDFQALQNYMKTPSGKNLNYVIFDLLALDGEDLREYSLKERKKKLKNLLKNAPDNIHFSHHEKSNDVDNFKNICEKKYEGLIYKKENSLYLGERNKDWLKLKCDNRQEFVIGGYLKSDKTNNIRALLVGYYDDGKLIYAGKVGTGFTNILSKELITKFNKIKQKNSPFNTTLKIKNIIFLKPLLIAEIKFAEWTSGNFLRQASFKGLRIDKESNEVVNENKEVNYTNLDKVLFKNPTITKGDLLNYYQKVSQRMFPYLEKRLLSLINCPQGITSPCFFKKHPYANSGLKILKVEDKEYFYIQNSDDIAIQVQMNTIEFHCYGSNIDNLDRPDIMVFDLDPDVGMSLENIRQGAKDLKTILSKLNLTSFLKTSGGKGYHIVVPFKTAKDWDSFKEFSHKVAKLMEQTWPDRYTSNIRKEKRKGKIFIDWLRNTKGATSVVPYSVRARKGGKVSMPLKWSELMKIAPDDIDMKEAIKRLKNIDPWQDFMLIKNKQELN